MMCSLYIITGHIRTLSLFHYLESCLPVGTFVHCFRMGYQRIRFYNFRNLADKEIELGQSIYYLIGENGAGKSSFLEGLYLLSYGSSFRDRHLEHCLRLSAPSFVVSGITEQYNQCYRVQIQYDRSSGKKSINLDNKKLQDRKELLQLMPSIIFTHGDIAYIKGSPRERRQFIDQTISLVDPYYVELLRNYTCCLVQRNWVLKNKKMELLSTYTLQMVEAGLEIQQRRALHITQLSQVFSDLFHYVSNFGTLVSIEYQPSWPQVNQNFKSHESVQNCLEYLDQRLKRDILLGSSQSGPHRDHLQFRVHNQTGYACPDFTKLASTGQLRLAALILKSAQAAYLQKNTSTSCALLFDDVLLEMDSDRRKLFLSNLPPYQQIFFTLLPNEDYQSYPFSDYQVFQIQNGQVRLATSRYKEY